MESVHRLLLLRHAKSSWDRPELADHDRPLAPRGRRAATVLAKHLQLLPEPPQLVLCSSAARTVETLQRIRVALPMDLSFEVEERLYGADAGELLAQIRQLTSTVARALVIGHNPGIGDLAVTLAGHGDRTARTAMAAKFPTSAVAHLAIGEQWDAVVLAAATLEQVWTLR